MTSTLDKKDWRRTWSQQSAKYFFRRKSGKLNLTPADFDKEVLRVKRKYINYAWQLLSKIKPVIDDKTDILLIRRNCNNLVDIVIKLTEKLYAMFQFDTKQNTVKYAYWNTSTASESGHRWVVSNEYIMLYKEYPNIFHNKQELIQYIHLSTQI